MAESVAFSLACKILSAVASPAFQKAYEKGLSIWEARDELVKLRVTIETIQAVLLDAEKKQQGYDAVKNWIKRLKGVLYDVEDLFDEVATEDLLMQQMMEGNNKLSWKKQVRVSYSKLNPTISRNSIAKKVKDIRKSLLGISTDMAHFEFVRCQHDEPMFDMRRGRDPGCFVDAKAVIGRDEDKKSLLEMLFNNLDDAKPDVPVVIAIVGIGGMGKTTLAQLVYNDDVVRENFKNRWFACISDTCDEKEIFGKIFHSIGGENYTRFSVSQLQTKIRESIEGKKYFLVLDDLWENHRGRWQDRISLLSGGAKGSRIIVTTRLPSVVNAVGAVRVHNLKGLSEDDSWNLFKRLAFNEEYEKDPRRESLGREILKRCRRVPLAIRSIGSLLSEKNTILEWEAIEKEGIPILGRNYNDETMGVLKLSFDHLPSNLKHCFAYCALFPKGHKFKKRELVYLWISQGYIEPDNEESDFMHLLRRGVFQEAEKDDFGEIVGCKMHDIMHDLALYVAGEESIVLIHTSPNTISGCTRHVSIRDSKEKKSWDIPAPLLNVKRLRTCLLNNSFCNLMYGSATIDRVFASFKLLRTLSLSSMRIENISPSIGELKLLRYLDLSRNEFEELPDSMTNLVNLLVLDLRHCTKLNLLPKNFRKLINLRHLNTVNCHVSMPVGIGKMTRLRYLDELIVGEGNGLDALAGLLLQLRGKLMIWCKNGTEVVEEDWDGDECGWKLPVSLQQLQMWSYGGIRIPDWGNNGGTNNLAYLDLSHCEKVQYLPPLKFLPNLRRLQLHGLSELEFVEEEEQEDKCSSCIGGGDGSIFFPRLEKLSLDNLPKLRGWWRKVADPPHFPLLSQLSISRCQNLELKSFPLCLHLRELHLDEVDNNTPSVIQEELPSKIFCSSTCQSLEVIIIHDCKWLSSFRGEALASLRRLDIMLCGNFKSLHVASPHLHTIEIRYCFDLMSFELVEAPTTASLQVLKIEGCEQLKVLHIAAHPNAALEELEIIRCSELELWELQDERWLHLDWDSLPNLRRLALFPLPASEKLPHCLRHRQALGQLRIIDVSSRM